MSDNHAGHVHGADGHGELDEGGPDDPGRLADHLPEGASAMTIEVEWEPGGDVIHYQDGNALTDARTRFVVTVMYAPGKPLLELVDEEEPARRAHLRAPRPTA
ncbi:hypothetical protein [Streptomyces sp. NPDC018972]|uniref:hypothetical protein n=1 Tax=Streptomyces sp. NPDC018972 TaxID=3365060 RepID=UPI0037BE20D3